MDRLQELCGQAGEHGLDMHAVAVDLRSEASIMKMFAHVREQWDGVDVLINNAGLGYKAPLLSGQTEHWREMLEVNVLGLCICTREAIADMRRRGDLGHVIHISSMSGHRVPAGSGVYSATKFAVRSLTEGLRQELRAAGSGIRVSSVSPGFVRTEFAAHYHQDTEAAKETYSRFEVMTPGDVADAVAFALLSPQRVQIHDILVRPTAQLS
jgi:NADP-dependent 3-hydroxy acid dehydrogenase YdfG